MMSLESMLNQMAEKQLVMDKAVYERFEIEEPKTTLKRRTLALYVELGECANEARTFKFWSDKPPAAFEDIVEEYVDSIHFGLSIGLTMGHLPEATKRLFYASPSKEPLTERYELVNEQLEKCFEAIALMARSGYDFHNYIVMMQKLLNLGTYLGITADELYSGYMAKNAKNLERQEAGY